MFHFTCFNVEDPDDPSVGLFNGELAIPGNLLRREVFEPVVNQVRSYFNLLPCKDYQSSLNSYNLGHRVDRGTGEED